MTIRLWIFRRPRIDDADMVSEVVRMWEDDQAADPAAWSDQPNTDVGWFVRELLGSMPELEVVSDAPRPTGPVRTWLPPKPEDEPRGRVAVVRLEMDPGHADASREAIAEIYSLALKYDLLVFEPATRTLREPTVEMAAYASATFWPYGAIRAGVAGIVGAGIAVGAWIIGLPIVSGIAVLVGAFLVLTSVLTFGHDLLSRLRSRA